MPKNIEPLNPEELKNSIDQNGTQKQSLPLPDDEVSVASAVSQQPVSSANPAAQPGTSPATTESTYNQPVAAPVNSAPLAVGQSQRTDTGDPYERKKRKYKIINLTILLLIIVVVSFLSWHFWVAPNKKSGKTILGTTDETTLAGLNKDNTVTLPDGTTYADPEKPINIPSSRQTYSLENDGYKYTFDFLKNSEVSKYSDVDFQDIVTPAGSYTISALIRPAKNQEKLVCEKKQLDNFDNFTVKMVNVLGQDYPLCGGKDEETELSSSYTLRFYHLGIWHEFHVGHLNHGVFTEQFAVDILNSLKVEKNN